MVILQALPTARFIPSTDEFREAVASTMGVASPLCKNVLGHSIQTVGRSRGGCVDGMGYNLTTVWGVEKQPRYTLHNTIASAIAEEAKLAGWHVRETPEDILVADATAQPAPILTTEIPGDLRKKLIPDTSQWAPQNKNDLDCTISRPLAILSNTCAVPVLSFNNAMWSTNVEVKSIMNTRKPREGLIVNSDRI